MAFRRWRADDSPTLIAGFLAFLFFRGSGPVLLRNPILGDPDPLPPLDPRMPQSHILDQPTAP